MFKEFSVTNEEYDILNKQFGELCYFIAHQLIGENIKNNFTDDFDDVVQEIRLALLDAARYYKRQTYIEDALKCARLHCKGERVLSLLVRLETMWQDRKTRRRFKKKQEDLLERLLDYIPQEVRPSKQQNLKMNKEFFGYCKSILWNRKKFLGKKISRDRPIRSGILSLSQFDHRSFNVSKIH